MKITIEPTNEIASVGATLVRIWQGTTNSGIHCRVGVYLIEAETPLPFAKLTADSDELHRLLDGTPLL
jgi:hypothetical protein